jgi:hypothetical protein
MYFEIWIIQGENFYTFISIKDRYDTATYKHAKQRSPFSV